MVSRFNRWRMVYAWVLGIAVVVVVLFFALQHRFMRIDIATVAFPTEATDQHPLDAILLKHLSYLATHATFDELLARQQTDYQRQPLYVDTFPVTQAQFNRFAQYQSLHDLAYRASRRSKLATQKRLH